MELYYQVLVLVIQKVKQVLRSCSENCFEVIDRILSELNKRFDQPATMLKGIAACSSKSCSFFNMEVIRPLAKQYGIGTHSLAPQLDVAKNLLLR